MRSGKSRSASRQGIKNARRARRHGMKRWMRDKPMHKRGMGGTDKSGTVKPSKVYYSQANAERLRGHPSEWPGLPFRPK